MTLPDSERTNFLGLPIDGDINRNRRVDQRPRAEFEPLVQVVLDDPIVREFGWRQYTPYFNDGEECVFGTSRFWVTTVDDPNPNEIDDLYNYDVSPWSTHATLGGLITLMDGPGPVYEGSHEATWRKCNALRYAIDGGQFYDVLFELFGDHAEITVTHTGITVETYEHE